MPLIPGQGSGLYAGLILVSVYTGIYIIKEPEKARQFFTGINLNLSHKNVLTEFSDEIIPEDKLNGKEDSGGKNNE